MPPTTNKQQALTHLVTALKRYHDPAEPDARPVLEQLVYGTIREGTTREVADRAYKRLSDHFFDWNEIRVSSPHEVEEQLKGVPEAGLKAQRIVGLLQEVFEQEFSYSLEEVNKKGLKMAAKQLARLQDSTDFAVAWVVQQALGGHAIPLDGPMMRSLRRLGVADEDESPEAVRSSLEHFVPKARGPMFAESLGQLAKDYCWDEDPNCSACPLRGECPTGQDRAASEPRPTRKPR